MDQNCARIPFQAYSPDPTIDSTGYFPNESWLKMQAIMSSGIAPLPPYRLELFLTV